MASRSSRVSTRPSACCLSARWRRLFSVMMTAPSTIRPKSSAPRLIRLALMRPCHMPIAVISMAMGITSAVISAARKLPSSTNSTAITSRAPSERLRATVPMVASTNWVRSSTVSTLTPAGSDGVIARSLASTAADTVRLLAPINIRAVPTTTSRPFSLALPVRVSPPIESDARSRIRTGTPPRVVTTTAPSSSMVSRRPPDRTTNPSPLRSM